MAEATNKGEKRVSIDIGGIVQGVGFRPFVYTLAASLEVRGMVFNTAAGVTIRAEGEAGRIDEFLSRLRKDAPAAARIDSMTIEWPPDDMAGATGVAGPAGEIWSGEGRPGDESGPGGPPQFSGFTIGESIDDVDAFAFISPDLATCPDCIAEMLDPNDRRYLYPFINCTNCGPRYSITLGVPYDRALTTMSKFKMCPKCQEEYDNPGDRRFHAQPNACPDCGPAAQFIRADHRGQPGEPNAAVASAAAALAAGEIVAIKGLGGFHLACDAFNHEAVARLRARKRTSNKPFAVMAKDIDTARRYTAVSADEKRLLAGSKRPIVLLQSIEPPNDAAWSRSSALAPEITVGNRDIGIMLPYTPLHHLLFHKSSLPVLVMTSGNLAEEPIVIDNDEAILRLGKIADGFLIHDRDIYMRVDDSIVRHSGGRDVVIRRGRGYAPATIDLRHIAAAPARDVFAAGAQLKNTFCIVREGQAIISQHLGDLENLAASDFYTETYENICRSFRASPQVVASDLHPEYASTRFADQMRGMAKMSRVAVQHHHAHIAACMAENGITGEVIGIAFDGAGLGDDKTFWGGEFLVCGYDDYRRVAHLKQVPLPGGDTATRNPWRMAVSYILGSCADAEARAQVAKLFSPGARLGASVDHEELNTVRAMIASGINSPLTSSVGRLFDAVAAITQSMAHSTFEGEAAIGLEQIADSTCSEHFDFSIIPSSAGGYGAEPLTVDLSSMIVSILNDASTGAAPSEISAKFHNTLVLSSSEVCRTVRDQTGLGRVVLSGGVFQNQLLSRLLEERLTSDGFEVITHCKVPASDGGISLGQAAIALATSRRLAIGEYSLSCAPAQSFMAINRSEGEDPCA